MENGASADANIQTALLEALGEGLAAAILVYDRHDLLVFASASISQFFPVPRAVLAAGTRLRDYLGAIYDSGVRFAMNAPADRTSGREGWLSAQIARHWKERSDSVECFGRDRWVRLATRRLSSGFGVCVIRDVSDEMKREEQWRLDLERVQLTEEILDSLPFPVSVKDRGLAYAAVNRAMCRLLRNDPEKILGRTDRDIQSPEQAAMFELSDRRVLETGVPLTFPEHLKSDEGEDALLLTHKWRVGKPGRYFVVTVPQDVTGIAAGGDLGNLLASATTEGGLPPRDLDYGTLRALSGQRVLLVTANRELETKGLRTLSRLGFECCSVRNSRELDTFLEMAGAADMSIDLVVLDTDMDVACLEIAERRGIDALTLDGWQIANELAFSVARRLNRRKDTAPEVAVETKPLAARPADMAEPAATALDVLVVEDNDVNRIVFAQILEGLGYSHAIAVTGEEALKMWRDNAPRIVFLDTTLPDMTGGEVARRLRAVEAETGNRVPIVGVLPRATDGGREACLADGMDDVLLKPISPDMIEAVMRRLLSEGAAPGQARA